MSAHTKIWYRTAENEREKNKGHCELGNEFVFATKLYAKSNLVDRTRLIYTMCNKQFWIENIAIIITTINWLIN